jgi:hypothetical protein
VSLRLCLRLRFGQCAIALALELFWLFLRMCLRLRFPVSAHVKTCDGVFIVVE